MPGNQIPQTANIGGAEREIFFRGGNAARPGIAFFDPTDNDLDTGFYLEEDGSIAVTVDGTKRLSFSSTGGLSLGAGTITAPSLTLSDTNVGWYRNGLSQWAFSNGTVAVLRILNGGLILGSSQSFGWENSDTAGGTFDLIALRDAADTFALRRGTNPQAFRAYNTYTDSSNYEHGGIRWTSNVLIFGPTGAGTGSNSRSVAIESNATVDIRGAPAGATRWTFNVASGHLLTGADNSYDIGAVGATRPRNFYFGGRYVGGLQTVAYSASMTPDAALGNEWLVTVTNGTAFTVNAPTNPATGQRVSFTIRNTSGGAAGVATWNAVFKMTAWVQPANGFSRTVDFRYDGTNWVEVDRTTADVPN